MQHYSIILEVILYATLLFLFSRKKELVVLYLPLLFFIRNLIEEFVLRQMIWYFLISFILVFVALRVNFLRRVNLCAIVLLVYFTILYIFSHSMSNTRSSYFAMVCLIFVFFIAPNLFEMHGRKTILYNLHKMSLWVILFFVFNTTISSATGYSPYQLYGRTTGVLYGTMGPTEFMVLPIAMFIYLMYHMDRLKMMHLAIILLTFGLVVISFRRSVVVAAVLALLVFFLILMVAGDKKRISVLAVSFVGIVGATLLLTDFTDQFQERYESRFTDRELVQSDEGRFTDHIMVYEDIFVHDRYSMTFGYGFFNSSGNYAGGMRGDRSLHPDIAVIVHASGLLGLAIYFAMVIKGFSQSWRAKHDFVDKGIWLFCLAVFIVFTLSGRIQETAYAMAIFLLLFLPMGNGERVTVYERNTDKRKTDVENEHEPVAAIR